ncbi:30S ribosomal protein S8 [Candidatus Shapirobacteria bacterium]|nr:30S ribosomal protein S8 [Candidatus Shapirobacteria bacterium]
MITSLTTDFIIRIKNSALAGRKSFKAPSSKFNRSLAETLKRNGFVSAYAVSEDSRTMTVDFALNNDEPKVSGVKLFSKPGRRWYETALSLPWGQSKESLIIVSTSSGVMSQREAKKLGIGGEIIAEIY